MGYPVYPQMKGSETAWIQNVPEHWRIKRLKFSTELINQKMSVEDSDLSYLGLEHIESWTGKRLEGEISASEGLASAFSLGDVLFGKLRPYLAKVHLAENEGLISSEALVIRSNVDVEPAYLKYYLLSRDFINTVDSSTYGSKMPRASWGFIGNLPLLLPEITEQEAIARFLDHKTGQLDALIAKKQALLAKLAEQRTALISQAVTQGLNPNVPMKDSDVAWLGKIPAHWDTQRLRFLMTMSGGLTPRTSEPKYWNGDIPWISPKDMKSERIEGSIDSVTDEALHETTLRLYQPGKVLIVVRGMILAHTFPVAVNEVPVTVNQDMKVLETTINPEYLAILLRGIQNLVLSIVEESAHGTKVLRTDLLKNITLPVPPRTEQDSIIAEVERIYLRIDKMANTVSAVTSKLQEYRSALITNAVTGKIDVRNIKLPEAHEPKETYHA